ncbi:amino acid ABC transporter substrate-binding protein, partial [Pseudomonas sp.]
MNVKSAKPAGLWLACLLAVLPVIATASTLERVRASNTLTLGYLPDFEPFSGKDGDKVSGYAMALCEKIADKVKADLGLPSLQVRYQPVTVADEISSVSSGKVDILCTPTPATLQWRKTVSFSIPIYTAGLSAVVRANSHEALLKIINGKEAHTGPTWRATLNRGLSNQTFAAIEGGVTEDWLRDEFKLLGLVATLVTVKDNDEGIKLVADGKADAFLSERMLLKTQVAKDYPQGELTVVDRIFDYAPASMVIGRGDEDFRLLVDTELSELY